jgi:tetratricopeptide (TPR) repeat protein
MGLAVRQVDARIVARLAEYPRVLPLTHPAALAGWEPQMRWEGGVRIRYAIAEFRELAPLAKQLEVNRCHAEARLALAQVGELQLPEDEEEWTLQRAAGILPGYEDQRFLELVSCRELAPEYVTSNAHRFLDAIALAEREFGQATALCYGFLLLSGARTRDDFTKYGRRVEEVFDRIIRRPGVAQMIDKAKTGLRALRTDDRIRLMRQALAALASDPKERVGTVFLLTQVIDGFLGLRPGGVGTSFGLAVLDAIIIAKLGFRVGMLARGERFFLAIATAGQDTELWDPLDPDGRVPVGAVRRMSTADVFVEGYVRLARGYVSTRAYAHVERVAKWLLEMRPDLPEALELLGVSSVGLGRPREAVDYCARSLSVNPRQPEAWLVQGNAYAMLSRWSEAIAAYKKAIALQVGYAEAYNNLGLALDRHNEHARAVGAFNQALRVNPGYVEAWYNLGNSLLEHDKYEQAIGAYRRAVERNPAFAGAYYNMGQAHYRMGDKRQALEAYQAAVAANPKHAGAWHNLGIVYRDLGEPERAVEAIERAVSINPMLLR